MHSHHSDMFNGIEFGISFEVRGRIPTDPPPVPTATTTIATRTAQGDGHAKSIPVTPTDQAKESIKDGKISKDEQAALDKTPAGKGVVKDEQKRLSGAVQAAEGNDYVKNKDGKLELRDGKPIKTSDVYAGGYAGSYGVPQALDPDTDHEKRVGKLGKEQNADELQGRIDKLKADGTEIGVPELKADKDKRLAEEGKVVDVIVDKTAYVGTLEAEKAELAKSGNADAANDFQKLREEAQGPLEKFIKNDGQVYEPDVFGDDWDKVDAKPEDASKQFDTLAKQYNEHPDLLDQWAAHQGDSNDAVGNMEEHLKGIDDPDLHDKIAGRYEAAQELKGIFERYNKAKGSADGTNDRVQQIDAEIGTTNASIEDDKKVLSSESKSTLEKRLAPIDGIIPAAPTETTTTTGGGKSSTSTPTDTTQANPPHKPGASTPSDPGTDASNSNPNPTPGTGAAATPATPVKKDVKIDYTTPERQKEVLAKAQERELLPAGNTSFDAKGQAVYEVQKGDSYWRIADMSDGQPPHAFDTDHFTKMLNSNSEALGRDPGVGMLYIGDPVVLPNRSVQDLVQLLKLPETEQVEEPAPAAQPTPRNVR
ncbi:MAG: hypothetical protein JWM98_1395 [Thermoleophilia bacterium]|nr:hypothetical protein [Thermoleophilia bacterium]